MTDFDFKKPSPKKHIPLDEGQPEHASQEEKEMHISQDDSLIIDSHRENGDEQIIVDTAAQSELSENREHTDQNTITFGFNTKKTSHVSDEDTTDTKKSRVLSTIIVIFIILILLLTLGFGIYLAQDKLAFWKTRNDTDSAQINSVGTFVAFEEGKVGEKTLDDESPIYKNDLFPNFEVTTNNGTKWKVTESDKTKGELIKYDVIFKNGDLNLVFAFYTDNGGLKQDSICMKESDVVTVDANWAVEKRYNEVYQDHIGYFVMPVKSYFNRNDPNFNARFTDYQDFIKDYSTKPLEQNEVGYCSTAQRVFKTKTSIPQPKAQNDQNEVLLRVFTPKADLTDAERTVMYDLIRSIKY